MKKRGFTLIELLVVMAIIAMLASVVLATLTTMQTKSRDTRRLEDVNQLKNALSLYYIDNNGFPLESTAINIDGSDDLTSALVAAGAISAFAGDPNTPIYDYTYQSQGVASYTITFCLETDSIPNYSQGCGNTISP